MPDVTTVTFALKGVTMAGEKLLTYATTNTLLLARTGTDAPVTGKAVVGVRLSPFSTKPTERVEGTNESVPSPVSTNTPTDRVMLTSSTGRENVREPSVAASPVSVMSEGGVHEKTGKAVVSMENPGLVIDASGAKLLPRPTMSMLVLICAFDAGEITPEMVMGEGLPLAKPSVVVVAGPIAPWLP
jgi:hypothetical protein